jgi:FkbM family methyltransferase
LPGFHYLPFALGAEKGKRRFHESKLNVSGSLLDGHRNIISDPVVRYDVDVVTLEELLRIVGRDEFAIVKMDVEGAEHDVIKTLRRPVLTRVRQLIVEFHHDTVRGLTWGDTLRAIRTLESQGMKALVYNGRDCLFYW